MSVYVLKIFDSVSFRGYFAVNPNCPYPKPYPQGLGLDVDDIGESPYGLLYPLILFNIIVFISWYTCLQYTVYPPSIDR